MYSLSNFQVNNTVLLTMVTMLHITFPGLSYFITGSLYFLPNPNPSPHQSVLCIYEFSFLFCFVFRLHIYVRSYRICLSLTYFT